MNDDIEKLDSGIITEDCPLAIRLTRPQKNALECIYKLNSEYAKRWFTQCELSIRVYDSTINSLVKHGFLLSKKSLVNPHVTYYQATGKGFEMFLED